LHSGDWSFWRVRNFMDIVGKTQITEGAAAPKEPLSEMPRPIRGVGRDMLAADTEARTSDAFSRLLDLDRQGPGMIDGDAVDLGRPALAAPPRALPGPGMAARPAPAPAFPPARRMLDVDGLDDVPGTALAPMAAPKTNLPATDLDIEPRWMKIAHVAEPFRSALMLAGQALFSGFTKTPVGEIRLITGLTHSPQEVRALKNRISAEGQKADEMEISRFGLKSQVQRWHWRGHEVLVTQDDSGPSIFTYPVVDGILNGHDQNARLIGENTTFAPRAKPAFGRKPGSAPAGSSKAPTDEQGRRRLQTAKEMRSAAEYARAVIPFDIERTDPEDHKRRYQQEFANLEAEWTSWKAAGLLESAKPKGRAKKKG